MFGSRPKLCPSWPSPIWLYGLDFVCCCNLELLVDISVRKDPRRSSLSFGQWPRLGFWAHRSTFSPNVQASRKSRRPQDPSFLDYSCFCRRSAVRGSRWPLANSFVWSLVTMVVMSLENPAFLFNRAHRCPTKVIFKSYPATKIILVLISCY